MLLGLIAPCQKKFFLNKKMSQFFGGSHFVLVGKHILDFFNFYFRIRSACPELLIWVEVKIWILRWGRWGPLGPQRTKIQAQIWRGSPHFIDSCIEPFWADRSLQQHRIWWWPPQEEISNGTGNSFPMLNCKKLFSIQMTSFLNHMWIRWCLSGKNTFKIFIMIDFCFMDIAWKI